MALDLSAEGLLPLRSNFFRFRFPFFAITPATLNRIKQTMFYVDFDDSKTQFVSPIDRAGDSELNNSEYFDQLWALIRYIAYNREYYVFDSKVMAAFRNVNYQAQNVRHWATLIRLFYACVLHHPTGMAEEEPLEEIVEELRSEHGMDQDDLVEELTKLGEEIRQSD